MCEIGAELIILAPCKCIKGSNWLGELDKLIRALKQIRYSFPQKLMGFMRSDDSFNDKLEDKS